MIILYHDFKEVKSIVDFNKADNLNISENEIAACLIDLAIRYPEELLIWCHISQKENLNIKELSRIFHHEKIMASYHPDTNYFTGHIGYVEESIFVNVNKNVSYPTWQMSGMVGGIHASILNSVHNKINLKTDFNYFLNSLAKTLMPLGLFCYSEPQLFKSSPDAAGRSANIYTLFRFTREHYKTVWIFLLFLNLMIYEKKFPLLPFLFSFFYKHRSIDKNILKDIPIHSSRNILNRKSMDVVIPTMGRKKYLFDVLTDLNNQSIKPVNVIIVEQNPVKDSVSELDYMNDSRWDFHIKHTFIHETGACNARNIALDQTESEWIFFADDDIRLKENCIEEVFENIKKEGSPAFTLMTLRSQDIPFTDIPLQWSSFGSGCSIIKRDILKNIRFDLRFEHGFGEDSDFGMQLRNMGVDIIYLPQPRLLHLKAPSGGFRMKKVHPWDKEKIKPKPAPTVMLYHLLYKTKQQVNGYKTVLFFKFYRRQSIKNPLKYFLLFKKKWDISVKWAEHLKNIKINR